MSSRKNDPPKPAPRPTPFIHRHPWIIVAAIFLFLIVAWTILITIASKHRPEKVPLEHISTEGETE